MDPIEEFERNAVENIRDPIADKLDGIMEMLDRLVEIQEDVVRELRAISEHMTGMDHHDGKY